MNHVKLLLVCIVGCASSPVLEASEPRSRQEVVNASNAVYAKKRADEQAADREGERLQREEAAKDPGAAPARKRVFTRDDNPSPDECKDTAEMRASRKTAREKAGPIIAWRRAHCKQVKKYEPGDPDPDVSWSCPVNAPAELQPNSSWSEPGPASENEALLNARCP